jgi:hypothetical protein
MVNGSTGSRILAMSAIPGITNGQRYDVKLRALHLDLNSYTAWTSSNDCVKTIGAAGMPLNLEEAITDQQQNWILYPNPSLSGEVYVMSRYEGWVTYELYNQLGSLVASGLWNVQPNVPIHEQFDVRNGLYHLKLKSGNENTVLTWIKE